MSVFALKIVAMLSMVIDHLGHVLALAWHQGGTGIMLMRAVGRMAFPIFAFLIVNGFEKSSDRMGYLSRLSLFAIISQIPFTLAFNFENYLDAEFRTGGSFFSVNIQGNAIYIVLVALAAILFLALKTRDRRFIYIAAAMLLPMLRWEAEGISILGDSLNVFYSLAVCLAVICVMDCVLRVDGKHSPARLILMAVAAAAAAVYILPQSDYGFDALLLIVVLYLCRSSRLLQGAVTALWAYKVYSNSVPFIIGVLPACVLIALYKGRKGRAIKFGFYLVYPVHLLALFFLGFFLD